MAKRFGFGEYEREDAKVKPSIIHLRHSFLSVLIKKREICLKDLLGVISFDLSPLGDFISFLNSQSKKVQSLEDEYKKKHSYLNLTEVRKEVIKQFVPDWETLNSYEQAKPVCDSLKKWADTYNLDEEWCLDYAVMVLRNFEPRFVNIFSHTDFQNLTDQQFAAFSFYFDHQVTESFHSALSDFYFLYVDELRNSFSKVKVPIFQFVHRDFKTQPVQWFSLSEKPEEFIEGQIKMFDQRIEQISQFLDIDGVDSDAIRAGLNSYCDKIENLQKESDSETGVIAICPPNDYINRVKGV